jgi:zinc/manganese transport system substrate-binding protein/manganese/iron transport system substrate-binding protein
VPFYALAPLQDLRAPALASKHESAGDDESHGGLDPHFWHDPSLAVEAVQALEAALVRAEPEAEEQFAKNTAAYVSEIESLDRQLRSQFASVPAERRKMVTDHDAFGYLARRYGIEIVGSAIPSTSTAAEPNARDIAELIRVIESEGVCSVFSESSVDPRLVDQVASEAGARVVSDLYGDTLGPRGSDAATYVGMMRHNARVLVAGFAC